MFDYHPEIKRRVERLLKYAEDLSIYATDKFEVAHAVVERGHVIGVPDIEIVKILNKCNLPHPYY